MDEKLVQEIKDYLDECIIMQLATCSGEQPWCSNLHFACDDNFNLYWVSQQASRHSKELASNSNIAATVARPHELGQPPRGLQIEGQASIVSASDLAHVNEIYTSRYPYAQAWTQETMDYNNKDRTYYMLKPSKIVLFDRLTKGKQPQQELVL